MNDYNLPVTATKAFVRANDTGRFCFERRLASSKTNPNMLAFLGGKHEPEEDSEQALRRELKEEASIDESHTLSLHYLGTEDSIVHKNGEGRLMRYAYYLVTIAHERDAKPTAEVAGLEWHTLASALDADSVPVVRRLVERFRKELA